MQNQATTQSALRELLGLQVLAKALTDKRRELAATLQLEPGEKINIATEWGESLGSYSRPKPSFAAVIDDRNVVAAELEENELDFGIRPDKIDAAVQFLIDNGLTDLLEVRIPEMVEKRHAAAVLAQWRKTGQVPAGWRIVEKEPGAARITPTKLAKDMVADFINQNQDSITFGEEQKQITDGKDA